MSRLDFGPKQKEVKITEIAKGLGRFKPKPGKAISFTRLNEALKKSGYRLESARVRLSGVLEKQGDDWAVREPLSNQLFRLQPPPGWRARPGEVVKVAGEWTADSRGEILSASEAQRSEQ